MPTLMLLNFCAELILANCLPSGYKVTKFLFEQSKVINV